MALEPKLATAQVGSFANLSNILPPRVIVQAWFGLVLASFYNFPTFDHTAGGYIRTRACTNNIQ